MQHSSGSLATYYTEPYFYMYTKRFSDCRNLNNNLMKQLALKSLKQLSKR